MTRTRFKDFIIDDAYTYVSNDINQWLDKNPQVHIIRWSASPGANNSIRLLIEYEEVYNALPKDTKAQAWSRHNYDDTIDQAACAADTGWSNSDEHGGSDL